MLRPLLTVLLLSPTSSLAAPDLLIKDIWGSHDNNTGTALVSVIVANDGDEPSDAFTVDIVPAADGCPVDAEGWARIQIPAVQVGQAEPAITTIEVPAATSLWVLLNVGGEAEEKWAYNNFGQSNLLPWADSQAPPMYDTHFVPDCLIDDVEATLNTQIPKKIWMFEDDLRILILPDLVPSLGWEDNAVTTALCNVGNVHLPGAVLPSIRWVNDNTGAEDEVMMTMVPPPGDCLSSYWSPCDRIGCDGASVTVIVDPHDVIPESDETNNSESAPF